MTKKLKKSVATPSQRFACIESLETRSLMASTFSETVNFQTGTAPVPADVVVDDGSAYASHASGLSYGWNFDNRAATRDRNSALSANQSYDTLIHMQLIGQGKWEMAVPDGQYDVRVVGGDASYFGAAVNILAEGQTAVNATTTSAKRWVEGTVRVTVSDGKLTLTNGASATNNKLCFVQINSVDSNSNPTTGTTLSWKATSPGPIVRVEMETANVNGMMYQFSGYSTTWVPSARVDRYDPATGTWTRMKDMRVPTTHAAVTVVGTDVWFVGGYTLRAGTTDKQDKGSNQCMIYDTLTDTYRFGPSLPLGRGSGGLGLINNVLYFVTGENAGNRATKECFKLDLANQSAGWKAIASIPEGRSHFGTSVINGKIYVAGGQDYVDANAVYTKTCYCYDPETNAWSRIADLPFAHSHLSPNAIVRDGKMIVLGGEKAFNVSVNDVLEYDPIADKWTALTPLPAPRAAGGAVYINGKIYFEAGKTTAVQQTMWIGTFV